MRYLGRKAELPQLLRGVAELEPRSSAAPSARPPTQARQALEALIAAREAQLAGERARARPARATAST